MKKVVPEEAVLIPGSAKCVFKGEIYDVYQWPQKLFDGSVATFEMLKRPDTVAALCIVDDKIMVLNDDQPHRGSRRSFPGGRADHGEDILDAVKREVHEETGYRFKNWRLLKVRQPHTKIEWFIYTFIAWGVEGIAQPHLDGGEKISVEFMTFEDVKRLVQSKVDYLGEEETLFKGTPGIQALIDLPEYAGKIVDR